MKKKLLSIIMTVAMTAALLTGCGNNNANTDSNQGQNQGQEESQDGSQGEEQNADAQEPAGEDEPAGNPAEGKFVGITMPSIGNDFLLALSNALVEVVEGFGATAQVDAADGDVTKQVEQIENYITMGADVIVVMAINGEAMTSVCQKALNEGIPVLAFAYGIPDGATTTMLSAEDSDMGAACAEMTNDWIEKTFADAGDGEVTIYLLGASNTPESVERSEAMKAIADNPKVNMIFEETENQDSTDAARTRIENAFQVYPDIDVVMCMNGTSAIGVDSYISSSDCPVEDLSKFAIFCVDETEEIVAKIMASENNESTLRGTVSMGSIADTANDFTQAITPIMMDKEPIEIWNGGCKTVTLDTLK